MNVMLKGALAALAAAVGLCAAPRYALAAEVNTGGIVMHSSAEDFAKGLCEGTEVTAEGITLKPGEGGYPGQGTYVSPDIPAEPFEYMVLSWNADTPESTAVKIEAQARVNGAWSKWLLIGTWSTSGDKASAMNASQSEDGIARVDTDTLIVKGSSGETADAFRYRLTLLSGSPQRSPTVRLVAAAFRNTLPGQAIAPADVPFSQEELDAFAGTLDVRPYSQMTRDPQFNTVICSAVSSAMVLDYKGVGILPEMAAMGVLDTYYDGYGNWPFNTAFIGSYGFESYIRYCSGLDDLKAELMQGNPVMCSVRYKRDESVDASLPIISAAPIDRTFGHLVIVVGYERQGDTGYVVVNDPAAASDGEVRRLYEESQFMEAWAPAGRIAYVTHGTNGGGSSAPRVENAALISTGRTKEEDGKTLYEYMLTGSETGPASAAKAVNPHNPRFETGVCIVVWDDEAGEVHSYGKPGNGPGVWLEAGQADKTVYVFLKTGDYYQAMVKE